MDFSNKLSEGSECYYCIKNAKRHFSGRFADAVSDIAQCELVVFSWSQRFHSFKECTYFCNVNELGFLFQIICAAHIDGIFLNQLLKIRTGIYE